MNKFFAVALIFVSLILVNCSESTEGTDVVVLADKEMDIKVDGMVCAMGCAKYIEKEVAKLDGVAGCKVNFEEGTATIEYSSEQTSDQELVDFIQGMNDGQYGVSITDLHSLKAKTSSTPEGNKSKDVKSSEVSFHFPELVTYFVSRVIR